MLYIRALVDNLPNGGRRARGNEHRFAVAIIYLKCECFGVKLLVDRHGNSRTADNGEICGHPFNGIFTDDGDMLTGKAHFQQGRTERDNIAAQIAECDVFLAAAVDNLSVRELIGVL